MYAIRIVFMSGVDDGRDVWLKDNANQGYAIVNGWEFVIGRQTQCDFVIPYDTQVSRQHALIRITPDALWIEDKQSRNGVIVNDERISRPTRLALRQRFRIGNTWLMVTETRV